MEKKLKVSLNDFGFLPKQPAAANRQENDPDITAEPAPPPTEVLDGNRESLPELVYFGAQEGTVSSFQNETESLVRSLFFFQQIQKKGWYQT